MREVQLEFDLLTVEAVTTKTNVQILVFPASKLAGRARREARAIVIRPPEKRRWHVERHVDQIRLGYLANEESFAVAERQARAYRTLLFDEINRLIVMTYLFGPEDAARSA